MDLAAGVLRVRGKGRKERLSPLGSYAQGHAQWLKVRRVAGRVAETNLAAGVRQPFGKRLTTGSVGRLLEKYLKVTGLDGRTTPHTLRHSFATHLVDRRRRHPQRARTAGAQEPGDDANLHARQHRRVRQAYEKAHPRAK